MVDMDLVAFCKERLIEKLKVALETSSEVRVISKSNAIEMMLASDEIKNDTSLGWTVSETEAGAEGSFFVVTK